MTTATAAKTIPRAKKKKVTIWLSEEAVNIAEKRRTAKSKGDREAVRRWNAAFQKQARKDKEANLQQQYERIEQYNRMGRTRDLFKEIKSVTEDKKVKERWKEYTENLYRKNPMINDVFTEKEYDDEPGILEDVREALNPVGK